MENVISEKVTKEVKEMGGNILHGRIDEWNEFVEFFVTKTDRVKYVVQNSRGEFGDCWFVYRVEKGRKGAVKTLFQSRDFNESVEYGLQAFNKSED
jgi:hypothetical protein